MKKFISILCVLIMLPLFAFAAPSPTPKKMIYSIPEIPFEMAEDTEGWPALYQWLYSIKDLTQHYYVLDAIYVMLDKEYEKVQWYLTCAIKESQKPFVCIIDSEAIMIQPLEVAEDGSVVMNFTDYEVNNYYLCFFIKDAE